MKVRHFISYLSPKYGGPTASVPVQCIGSKILGIDTSITVYENNGPYLKKLLDNGVEIIEIKEPKHILLRKFSLTLRQYLKEEESHPDIYHYHGVWLPSNHWISYYGRKNAIKCVINPRGDLEIARIKYNKIKWLKKYLIWHLYGKKDTNSAACIIATSKQESDAVRSLGITAPIAIIPNGIELYSFPQKIVHKSNEKKIALFLSRINPIKGLEYLIDAWSNLPSSLRANWELHIAGNSDPADYIDSLKSRVMEKKVTDSIFFIGQIVGDEKIRKYQEADVFILPTLNENFGNVIAEAMICETPVITTKNAPWKCIEDYHCGWWIDLSTDNLTCAMLEVMNLSDEERWELGKKGRKCIGDNFASEEVAQKTKMVYQWVLGEIEKPDFVEVI